MSRLDASVTIRPRANAGDGASPPNRNDVAARLSEAGITVRLRADEDPVAPSAVLALSDAELRALGVDAADLWDLLSDVDIANSIGGVVDVAAESELAERHLVRDGVDGNYRTAVLSTPQGAAHLAQALQVRGRSDGSRPNGFVSAVQRVVEFFVEVFARREYVTANERDLAVGAAMAAEHPETLRAILAQPNGETLLRGRLLAQRPANTDAAPWEAAVGLFLRGLRDELSRAPALPEGEAAGMPLLVRDQLAKVYAAAEPDARAAVLQAARDLALLEPNEDAQLAWLEHWRSSDASPALAADLHALAQASADLNPALRGTVRTAVRVHGDHLGGLATLIASPELRNPALTDAQRVRLLEGLFAGPATSEYTQTLLQTARLMAHTGVGEPVRELLLQELANPWGLDRVLARTTAFTEIPAWLSATEAVQVASLRDVLAASTSARELNALQDAWRVSHGPTLQALDDVLGGRATLAAGSSGREVLVAVRYLRALGYDGLLGPNEGNAFTSGDGSVRAAVEAFQRAEGLLSPGSSVVAGEIDAVTLRALYVRLRTMGLDPASARFTTTLSLNRPTRATDTAWNATGTWTPELIAEYREFAMAYMMARIPGQESGNTRRPLWEERVDCADLSYETLVQFARQRGLPVVFRAGNKTWSHQGPTPVLHNIQVNLGAMHLQYVTVPIGPSETPLSGDIGNMDWDQAINGHDSYYWHSHNIVRFDPLYRQASVIFGSLVDVVKQRALDTFNRRGFAFTVHDVPEMLIDGIKDDSGQGRSLSRSEQESWARSVLEGAAIDGHRVTNDDVSTFIAMIANESNLHRNAPTEVATESRSFGELVDGAPWADATASSAEAARLNLTYAGASFRTADIAAVVAAGSQWLVSRTAADLVAERGVPEAQRAEAAEALIAAARRSLRYNPSRDALADPGLRRRAVRDFNRSFGTRLSEAELLRVLSASDNDAALVVARGLVARVPEARREEAAAALVQAANDSRRFRRWDFAAFNRHR